MRNIAGDIIILHVYKEQQSYEVWWWETFFALVPHYWPQKLKLFNGDIILLNMCTINKDHMVHGYWDKKAQQIVFFVILGHFLPFDPPNNPENQNFVKMKKLLGDIIILHLCTTNDNHMMYGSWDMERDRIFCNFGAFFFPFSPLTIQKIKI